MVQIRNVPFNHIGPRNGLSLHLAHVVVGLQ